MPNTTRDFSEDLKDFEDRNITSWTLREITDTVVKILKQGDPGISEITVYTLLNLHRSLSDNIEGIRLYFVIENPAYPPATHMGMPCIGEKFFQAKFLEKRQQLTQEQLNACASVHYILTDEDTKKELP